MFQPDYPDDANERVHKKYRLMGIFLFRQWWFIPILLEGEGPQLDYVNRIYGTSSYKK